MIKIEDAIEKYYWLIYTFLLVVSGLMYVFLAVGGGYIWADEAYTMYVIKYSYKEIWDLVVVDVHLPLYYFALKLFVEPFGYSLLAARLFSVIPFVILIAIAGIQLKKLFDKKTAVVFMIMFLLFPFLVNYVIEIRMYSWAALLIFLNAIYAYRCYLNNKSTDWFVFFLTGIMGEYTHYFTLVSVGVIYGILFLTLFYKRELWKNYIISAVATIIAYVPWISHMVEQFTLHIDRKTWIGEITIGDIIEYVKSIFGTEAVNMSVPFAALFYLVAFIYIWKKGNKKDKYIALSMLFVPIGTIGVGVLASILIKPMFVIRYAIPAIPLMVLFMAFSIGKMRSVVLITMICTFFITEGIGHYAYRLDLEYAKRDDALDDIFLEQYEECDGYVVMTASDHFSWILSYYDSEKSIYINKEKYSSNPYKNQYEIKFFEPEKYECVMLLIDSGQEIPEKYKKIYNCEYISKLEEKGSFADVYIMRQ